MRSSEIIGIFKQALRYFMDGTSRHLVHFDCRKEYAGYAGAIESAPASMVSSHAVKRLFNAFSWQRILLFRRLLQGLFLWRLTVTRPAIIMAVAFFLFEIFKEDVCAGVVPETAYATTVRRNVIDFAARLVRTGGKIILRVTAATWKALQLNVLWKRCESPPRFA